MVCHHKHQHSGEGGTGRHSCSLNAYPITIAETQELHGQAQKRRQQADRLGRLAP